MIGKSIDSDDRLWITTVEDLPEAGGATYESLLQNIKSFIASLNRM